MLLGLQTVYSLDSSPIFRVSFLEKFHFSTIKYSEGISTG